eukprot:CFRG3597T1
MGDKLVKAVGLVGAVANWTIPIAALASMQKDASYVNPGMTGALLVYSSLFMRWSLAIYPPNYALFACHVTNFAAQGIQIGRYCMYKPEEVITSTDPTKDA